MIIKPSKKFAGSEMDSGTGGKYIKPEVRQVIFNKKNNVDGIHLYFLPAYKADGAGNGVWFKVQNIRDNFGDKFKDKYAVTANDPATHFEKNFKRLYPELAEVVEETNEKTGRAQKRYPNYGRIARRVIYNVALVQGLEKGAHTLDLPAFNGANILTKWMEGTDARGREKPIINDPSRCIPVFVKLNDGGGAPWEITPDPTDPAELPKQLADADYLYNLDDIFIEKPHADIISKLKEMFPDCFEECMAGYPGFGGAGGVKVTVASNPIQAVSKAEEVKVKPAPALANIPKTSTKKKVEVDTGAVDDVDVSPVLEGNPLANISTEEAAEYLRK